MHCTTVGRRWRERSRAALIAGLCLVAGVSGCRSAFGPSFAPPTVAVEGLDFSRPGLFTQELTVTLAVQNRMQRDLTIEAVDLELEVNGTRLGSGTLLKAIPLAADGAVTASIPVKVKTQDILNAFLAMTSQPRLAYAISGHVRLAGGEDGGRETVPFDEDGEFSLPFAPRLAETI